jgi:hypothetical protein
LTEAYLAALSRRSGDLFTQVHDLSPLRRQLVMASRAFLGWR